MLRSLALGLVLTAAACNDSKEYSAPGPVPQIQSAAGPTGAVASCSIADGGPSCPLEVKVVFRLAEGSFVEKGILRFEGDQNDTGVDRTYVLPATFGAGDGKDVTVTIPGAIPPNILRSGALYTYSVRLVTGAGDSSTPTTLTVTVP